MRDKAKEVSSFKAALSIIDLRSAGYRTAPWLGSDFECPVWDTFAGGHKTRIDFRVLLDDGNALTSPMHKTLERSLKTFLILQTHHDVTKGVSYSGVTTYPRLTIGLHVCEYILLRSKYFKLASYGLQTMTKADGYEFLSRMGQLPSHDSVYTWTDRLQKFLCKQLLAADKEVLTETLMQHPELSRTCESTELQLSNDELLLTRAWLWINRFYKADQTADATLYSLDSNKIAPLLYPEGTLRTTWKKPVIHELSISTAISLVREMQGVPVRGQSRTDYSIGRYVKALMSLEKLPKAGIRYPQELVEAAKNREFINSLALEPVGRYASLPHTLVLEALGKAISFSMDYCEPLLTSYVRLATSAQSNKSSIDDLLKAHDISKFLESSLVSVGVSKWSVSKAYQQIGQDPSSADRGSQALLETAFFQSFRDGVGLHELLYVLGGAALIMLGALAARRQGELIDLKADRFLDKSGTRLIFEARKTGAGGVRQELQRPIPSILIEVLNHIGKFHKQLAELEITDLHRSLFCFPKLNSVELFEASDFTCNKMLDRFCDFFELGTDIDGRRHYIRQHQLRRFFPMLFFWGNSFGGMDTLQWFLGQVDPRQLWRYISENVPGAVLRQTKVDYLVERTQTAEVDTSPLRDLLRRRFGTEAFSVLDADELGSYLEYLIKTSKVTVEPEFFSTPGGVKYLILVKVCQEN